MESGAAATRKPGIDVVKWQSSSERPKEPRCEQDELRAKHSALVQDEAKSCVKLEQCTQVNVSGEEYVEPRCQ